MIKSDNEIGVCNHAVAHDVLQDMLCADEEHNGWELEKTRFDKETTELTGWVRSKEGRTVQIRVSLWDVIHDLREKLKEREGNE